MMAMTEVRVDLLDIMVVENSPHDTRLIREGFELWSRPYRLSCYADGASAMNELMQRASQGVLNRTLLVLDWNLPGLHGSKLLRQLRADVRFNPVCVVVFTSSSSELDRDLAKRLGADRFVTKAVDLDEFFHALVSLQELV
jgi:DNA-binding response OmpR family regulator